MVRSRSVNGTRGAGLGGAGVLGLVDLEVEGFVTRGVSWATAAIVKTARARRAEEILRMTTP